MQDRENTGEAMTNNELLRAMYPGICGYKSNTGGMWKIAKKTHFIHISHALTVTHAFHSGALKNLRESTNNKKVRQYHKEFYRPENLTLLIVGQVKHIDVFRALLPLEQKIMSKVFTLKFIAINCLALIALNYRETEARLRDPGKRRFRRSSKP